MLNPHWGEIEEDENSNETENFPYEIKRSKIENLEYKLNMSSVSSYDDPYSRVTIKMNNPLITQTIEVMQQTEMLQSLIDTYSNKSGSSNYLLNPLQVIPEVHFPPENVANFVTEDRFAKPIWFIPPKENTPFTRGMPKFLPQIDTKVCRAVIRKAVSGQLRIAGFTDTAESALVLFTDAIEEFLRSFLEHISDVNENSDADKQLDSDFNTLEKSYYLQTNRSLISIHNYYKHHIIARNKTEIAEFNSVLQEYDKLMKQSQFMQKDDFPESDFLNILEMPQSNEAVGGVMQEFTNNNGVLLNGFETQFNGAFKDVFQINTSENNINEQQIADDIKQDGTEATCFMLQSHD